MERWLGRWSEQTYAIFRMVVGALFLQHGLQKVFGMLGADPAHTWEHLDVQMKLGGVIELVGGTMVLIGLQTGWAAFVCSGTMAVAFFQMHFKADLPLPIQNKGELAVLYCFAFLFIAAKGSGIWSISGRRRTA